MFVKLQESFSTHLQLSFHLSSRWLKEQSFFSLQLPLPSETASEQLEPTMRQALHFWLQDQPYLLWEQPELRLKGQDFEQGIHFEARLPVISAPKLPKLQDLKIELSTLEPLPGLLETVKNLQYQLAEGQTIPGPVDWNTRLKVDAFGLVNGIPIPDSALTESEWLLTPSLMFPGFGQQLLGLRAGQSKDVWVRLPEDYPIPAWAGQKAVYKVKIRQIEKLRLPRLDDTLAHKAAKGNSLNELEDFLLQERGTKAQQVLSQHAIDQVLQHLIETLAFELPVELVDAQMQTIWERTLLPNFKALPLTSLQLQKALPFWLSHRIYRRNCERNLLQGWVFKLLIDYYQISLSLEDLKSYLEPVAKTYQLSWEEAQQLLQNQAQWDVLVGQLLSQKAEERLMQDVQVFYAGSQLSLQERA